MVIKKISENIYELPKIGGMRVPGVIYASEKIIDAINLDNLHLKHIGCDIMLTGKVK